MSDAAVKFACVTCYSCGKKGHYQANCSESGNELQKKSSSVEITKAAEANTVSLSHAIELGNIVEIDEGW